MVWHGSVDNSVSQNTKLSLCEWSSAHANISAVPACVLLFLFMPVCATLESQRQCLTPVQSSVDRQSAILSCRFLWPVTVGTWEEVGQCCCEGKSQACLVFDLADKRLPRNTSGFLWICDASMCVWVERLKSSLLCVCRYMFIRKRACMFSPVAYIIHMLLKCMCTCPAQGSHHSYSVKLSQKSYSFLCHFRTQYFRTTVFQWTFSMRSPKPRKSKKCRYKICDCLAISTTVSYL